MTGPRVRVVGADRMARTMRRAEGRLADPAAADDELSRVALEAVRPEIPVVSARLRSSARSVVTRGVPGVIVDEPYAGPINWGWKARNIEPASFLQRGAESAEPLIEEVAERGVQQILNDVKGA